MRAFTLLFVSFVTTILVTAFAAHASDPCETYMMGAHGKVAVSLISRPSVGSDYATLDQKGLERLADALKKRAHVGAPGEFRIELFDARAQEKVIVGTPFLFNSIGARIFRGRERVEFHFELPSDYGDKAAATAQILTDVINHFELLKNPALLDQEIKEFRDRIRMLLSPSLKPLIPRPYLVSALTELNHLPPKKLFGIIGTQTLGRKFAAYLHARQMIAGFWLTYREPGRAAEFQKLIKNAARPDLETTDIVDFIVKSPRPHDRPWFKSTDRRPEMAIAAFFEILANRGEKVREGFLLPDQGSMPSGEESGDDDRKGGNGPNPGDTPSRVADPLSISPGLPDPGGVDEVDGHPS